MLKSYEASYERFQQTVANARTLKDKVGELEDALKESVAMVNELKAELVRAKPADSFDEDADDADSSDEDADDADSSDKDADDDDSSDKDADDDDSSDEDSDKDGEPVVRPKPLPGGKRKRFSASISSDGSSSESSSDEDYEPVVRRKPLPGGKRKRFRAISSDEDSDEDESVNMWKENEPPASNPNLDRCEACDYDGEEAYTGVFCMECGHDGAAK